LDTHDTLLAQLHLEGEIVRWETDLRSAGLPHVYLKGIGFDRWLDRSNTRVSRDIDLLCPRRAQRALAQLLRKNGYRCIVTEPNASTWLGPDNRIPIDLHDTLKGATVAPDVVWSVVERCIEYVVVAGISVPVLGSPARELVAGLHLTLAGAEDERAKADLMCAITRSSPETWKAADDLAREVGCRVLFQAGFGATPELRDFAMSLGFSLAGTEELLAPWSGRQDAIGLLPAFTAGSRLERVRLGSRFLRLHFAWVGEGQAVRDRDADATPAQIWITRIRQFPTVSCKFAKRFVDACLGARRLRRVLRVRERA
jgi:hypothetical protein